MNKVFVGKIVNTHGIKGEFRIKSDFERKKEVFKIGNEVIIKENVYKIASYRIHKGYDMITLEGINDINDVIPFKGYNLFVDRSIFDLKEQDYLLEDLLEMKIYLDDKEYGIVIDYTLGSNPLLEIDFNGKKYYIPMNADFITNVDIKANKIYVNEGIKGLIL